MGLQDNVKTIKGIGPKKASSLENLGIQTIGDLLSFYPRTYEDRRKVKSIEQLCDGETALVRGRIKLILKGKYNKRRKQTLKLVIEDETGRMEVVFFQAAYLEKTLSKEKEYEFFGKVAATDGKITMIHPDLSLYQGETSMRILPIYPLTSGVTQNDLRKWMLAESSRIEQLEEYIPRQVLLDHRLCGVAFAVKSIHFPTDGQELKIAKYRLIFDELFLLRAGILYIQGQTAGSAMGIPFDKEVKTEDFTKLFPYPLTGAQKTVLDEIEGDMESDKVMNRLVQGDVGSGKTAVAEAALYKAVKSGYQAVLMVPTELLARQHYAGLSKDFTACGINTAFLSGSLTAKEKRTVLQELELGSADVLIGTHAVIQPNVKFSNLGLVITDEQHRFGVKQRTALSSKGNNPDILVMTATPIPRTLAVVLYGDLDLSIIDEMPPGRQAIITNCVNGQNRQAAYSFLKKELSKGRQAYIVAPLIEDSETLDVRSAESLYEELRSKWKDYRIALLHGAMKQREKDFIMGSFYDGEIDILVSTVVIEVGINVPNATVMLIENSERFGLAQLHQLRGRVGRGRDQSYCILVTNAESGVAAERAKIMESTNDGFMIAEKDLTLRGPGEFFGIRQHGLPELRLADLVRHGKILKEAGAQADAILKRDPHLIEKDHESLKEKIETMFRNVENISI